MTKRDKLLERIRNNSKNVPFRDIESILQSYGFELKRVRGSHHVFSGWIGDSRVRIAIPYRQPFVKEAYVKAALELIDAVDRLKENGIDESPEDA